jgi:hypothetical protein
MRVGRLRGRCHLPASILSLSLALRSRGPSADSGGGWGPCPARRSTSCPRRGAGPAPLRAGGFRYRMDAVEHARPPCWPDLGCLGVVGSRAGSGRACAAPAGHAPRPSPPPATGVQTALRAPPVTLLLQVKTRHPATPLAIAARRRIPGAQPRREELTPSDVTELFEVGPTRLGCPLDAAPPHIVSR